MADFHTSYEDMIRDEGGYHLHTVKGDTGGMTYAGIARNHNPQWPGWAYIDQGAIPPTQMVRDFYRVGYWNPIRGDDILDQGIASTIFNFAVNTSPPGRPALAVKLAQVCVGATPDGDLGVKTLAALNTVPEGCTGTVWGELFELRYFLAKMTRYAEIANKDKARITWGPSTAKKFLLGWTNRAIKEAAR